ncbi:hypothetical protein D3C80_1584010 [compost metagenome]
MDVTVAVEDANKPGELTLQVDAQVGQDGVTYSVGKQLQIINSKVVAIFDANNGN